MLRKTKFQANSLFYVSHQILYNTSFYLFIPYMEIYGPYMEIWYLYMGKYCQDNCLYSEVYTTPCLCKCLTNIALMVSRFGNECIIVFLRCCRRVGNGTLKRVELWQKWFNNNNDNYWQGFFCSKLWSWSCVLHPSGLTFPFYKCFFLIFCKIS